MSSLSPSLYYILWFSPLYLSNTWGSFLLAVASVVCLSSHFVHPSLASITIILLRSHHLLLRKSVILRNAYQAHSDKVQSRNHHCHHCEPKAVNAVLLSTIHISSILRAIQGTTQISTAATIEKVLRNLRLI